MTAFDLDPRVSAWLREDQPGPGATTLAAVIEHARRHPRRRPMGGWLSMPRSVLPGLFSRPLRPAAAFAVAALGLAVVAVLYVGAPWASVGPSASPTASPSPSVVPGTTPSPEAIPSGLAGTWFGSIDNRTILLMLHDCAPSGSCGTLQRIDPSAGRCVHDLALERMDGETLIVNARSVTATTCGDTSWRNRSLELAYVRYSDSLHVRASPAGAPEVDTAFRRAALHELGTAPSDGPSQPATPFPVASGGWNPQAPTELPAALVGTWMSTVLDAYPLLVTVHPCVVGQTCGVIERIDDNGEHCVYALRFDSTLAGAAEMTTDLGNSFGCGWSGWSDSRFGLRAGADSLELSLPRGGTLDLARSAP